jgi:hypothetical protein
MNNGPGDGPGRVEEAQARANLGRNADPVLPPEGPVSLPRASAGVGGR